ncbi:MAG: dienelactone hydrolase family protein [Rhodospirillales bacterium]
MFEQDVDIQTEDGICPGFFAHPDGKGPYPAVILYMDAPGIREELRNFARRIADQGYFCLLPDMYYRLGSVRFNLAKRDDAMSAVIKTCRDSIHNALIVRDTAGWLAFLSRHPQAANGPKGCVGYCMSGQYVLSAVGSYPDAFAAGATLYGVGMVTDKPDSPHLLIDKVKAELYMGFAETDPLVPDNVIPDLEAALTKHGVQYRLDVPPGTRHGYCFPERAVYKEQAAEDAWTKIFDLYQRTLK